MRKLLVYYLLILNTQAIYTFQTLTDIQQFTAQYPEYPDNDQVLSTVRAPTQVTFHNFFAAHAPSWWQQIAAYCGIQSSRWNFATFNARLQQLSAQESQRLHSSVNHVMISAHASPVQPLRYILFGSIGGGIHSLFRILNHMVAQGLLDTNLVLQDPHTNILFLGDIIGASPYNLPTLDAILLILERNPGRATYLRGWSESNQRWQDFPLLSELEYRHGITGTQLRKLSRSIDDFFYILPSAYVITDASVEQALLCATKEVRDALSPTELARCTQTPNANVCTILAETPSEKPSTLNIIASLSTTIFGDTYHPMSLLHIAVKKSSAHVWHLISGISGAYRAIYRTQYEGYFILHCTTEDFTQSTISVTARLLEPDAPFSVVGSLPITSTKNTIMV